LFGVLAEVAQFVELGVKAGTNDAGIGSESGRLVGEGAFEAVADVGKFVNSLKRKRRRRCRQREAARGNCAGQEVVRGTCARLGVRAGCEAESDAAGEAFEILDTFEFFADFTANDGLLDELRDGVERASMESRSMRGRRSQLRKRRAPFR